MTLHPTYYTDPYFLERKVCALCDAQFAINPPAPLVVRSINNFGVDRPALDVLSSASAITQPYNNSTV